MGTEKNIGYVLGALTLNIALWVFIVLVAKAFI